MSYVPYLINYILVRWKLRVRSSTIHHQVRVQARTEQNRKQQDARDNDYGKHTRRKRPKGVNGREQNRTEEGRTTAARSDPQCLAFIYHTYFAGPHTCSPRPSLPYPFPSLTKFITLEMKTLGAPRGHTWLRPFSSGDRPRATERDLGLRRIGDLGLSWDELSTICIWAGGGPGGRVLIVLYVPI